MRTWESGHEAFQTSLSHTHTLPVLDSGESNDVINIEIPNKSADLWNVVKIIFSFFFSSSAWLGKCVVIISESTDQHPGMSWERVFPAGKYSCRRWKKNCISRFGKKWKPKMKISTGFVSFFVKSTREMRTFFGLWWPFSSGKRRTMLNSIDF